MADFAREVIAVHLEDEMRQSYLDYAMSVIIGRALPDVRDGLKPVHRRVLFGMHEGGYDWNKPYKKSARIVGDVMGKYHPHGDSAIYDTLVRMAQPFSLRYRLVDGQGNFGSVDGDAPAAMRYTEVRMTRLAQELLADLDKDTVDFVPTYDGSSQEPVVLPARVPHLLVNGSAGIAVGMATNVPPHNLGEVVAACVALIDDPAASIDELMQQLPGPDFPTAGILYGTAGIREAYHTGRGRILVRARTALENLDGGRQAIVVSELPYQVNKARLLERIAELVKDKTLDGIAALRDESDKDGMRVVIELRRGEPAEIVLNQLYQHTALQSVFGINLVALVEGRPRTLNLKEMLEAFLRHRREVVTRRTTFELRKARERAHVLEGLAVALANIDEVIAVIRAAPDPAEARAALLARAWRPGMVVEMLERAGVQSRPDGLDAGLGLSAEGYRLSPAQAQAILDMRLQRLTGLEQDKITAEYAELLTAIRDWLEILTRPERLLAVIRGELLAVKEQFGDARRTEIVPAGEDFEVEDLIAPEDVVVMLSHGGYAKAQPLSDYQAQRRGGRGKAAAALKEEDFIDQLFIANTHDTLLCFSSRGQVYWLKVYRLPRAARGARGRPLVNLLPLAEGERIHAVLPVRDYDAGHYVFMATAQGMVKKTALSEYSRPRASGIIAVDLAAGDRLVNVALTDGQREIMLFTTAGKAIRFRESEVRPTGRDSRGVRGIRLPAGHAVNALVIVGQGDILTVTENGYGKRTPVAEYPLQGRAGQGVVSIHTSARNGRAVGALLVQDCHELMLISHGGALVRTRAAEVPRLSRNTQGVRLMRLAEGERIADLARIETLVADDAQDDAGEEANEESL